jgi:hypothetical protein
MDSASNALADRIVGAGLATMKMFTVHLGPRHAPDRAMRDTADPVATRAGAGARLAAGGAVLIADERVAESFAAPGDDMDRLNDAFSVRHCRPAPRTEDAVEETGTDPAAVRRHAERAGVEVLPIAHELWRFYRLGER